MKRKNKDFKCKIPYIKPSVDEVKIDKDICLLMDSGGGDDTTPDGPDDGDGGGINWG